MAMRFCILGSGSAGNGLLVESGSTRVLLDCGFSIRETEMRLSRLGVDAASLSAIAVTHEHDDHASGVVRFLLFGRSKVNAHFVTVRFVLGQLAKILKPFSAKHVAGHQTADVVHV